MEGKNNRQELHSTLAHLALSIQEPGGLSTISWGHVTLLNVAQKETKDKQTYATPQTYSYKVKLEPEPINEQQAQLQQKTQHMTEAKSSQMPNTLKEPTFLIIEKDKSVHLAWRTQ